MTMPVLAALAAAPTLAALLPLEYPTADLALWLFSHAWASSYTEARSTGTRLLSWIPKWVDASFLYLVGNSQLLYAFLFEQYAFPARYGRIVLGQSSTYMPSKPASLPKGVQWPSRQTVVDHIAKIATPTATSSAYPTYTSPLLSSLKPSRYPTTPYEAVNPIFDYSPAHPAHTQLLCALLHPTEPSCRKTLINHFKSEWVKAARFSGVFAGLASLLFRGKKWVSDPETEIFKVAVATLQGATVLSGSVGTSWGK